MPGMYIVIGESPSASDEEGRFILAGGEIKPRNAKTGVQLLIMPRHECPSFQKSPLLGVLGSVAAAGVAVTGDTAIMKDVRKKTAYLQRQIDELDSQVRWLTKAVKILLGEANKENEACAVIETLQNQVTAKVDPDLISNI